MLDWNLVPVAQRIERRPPEPETEVRFLSGAPVRNLQAVSVRLEEFIPTQEGLGDYFIRNFGGRKIFNHFYGIFF